MKRPARDILAGCGIVAPILIADRITKIWAESALTGAPDIIPGVIGLRLAHNTGVAFSMFAGAQLVTIAFTSLIIIGLIVYLLAEKRPSVMGKMGRAGLWLFAAGGLGNLYDRIFYGHVVDMIDFRFMDFAVFNVADIAVCAGALLAALGCIITERKLARNNKKGT